MANTALKLAHKMRRTAFAHAVMHERNANLIQNYLWFEHVTTTVLIDANSTCKNQMVMLKILPSENIPITTSVFFRLPLFCFDNYSTLPGSHGVGNCT